MWWTRTRLAVRLGITHGALVVVLLVLLVVTMQGFLRMLGVMTIITGHRLSELDAEEQLHRSAWGIEVAIRHASVRCEQGGSNEEARTQIERARGVFQSVIAQGAVGDSDRLRVTARQYDILAGDAITADTCAFLALPEMAMRRLELDEELTDTWIERLHELHTDIEAKQKTARTIGTRTALGGLAVAVLGAIVAGMIARRTAHSVTHPLARLAADATRLGDGDFSPIQPVGGPPEIEQLRRDLERTREKLLGVDRLKQAFLASVSHELRSPLGRLREALALLADGTVGELTPKQARVLALASRACEQEVRIVEALLDMSRVSSGLPIQRAGGCDVNELVAAAVEAERSAAVERDVRLRVEQLTPLPLLRIDAVLVERAVANLVRNAVSVSPKGACVRIVVGVHCEGERRVRIDVVDEGPGLAAGALDRIFQPFSAAQVAGRPAGIGLGLSLARDVARAHGGDLVLATDAATTFRLELPVEHEESA